MKIGYSDIDGFIVMSLIQLVITFKNNILQNHRMIEVGRGLWRSFAPTPPADTLSPRISSPRTVSIFCLYIAKRRDFTTFLNNFYQFLATLKVIKKCFLIFRWNPLFVNLGLFYCHKPPLKRAWICPLFTSLQVLRSTLSCLSV